MKITKLFALSLAAGAAWALLGAPGTALAATKTWTGTDCPAATPPNNCNWSNGNNWQGGAAPVNGDDVIISVTGTQMSNFDIENLTLHNITAGGFASSSGGLASPIMGDVSLGSPLTLTGNFTFEVPTGTPPSGYYAAEGMSVTGINIVLGGDSVFKNVALSSLTGFTLDLNGHEFTYDWLGTTRQTTSLNYQVTGSGTLTIKSPSTQTVYLNQANDYSGTTNLVSADYITSLNPGVTLFGTSSINLSPDTRILFTATSNVSIPNTIVVSPPSQTGTFLENQIEFWNSNGETLTYTVPAITLNGNARFATHPVGGGTVTVNLAGITANGHCIQYGDNNTDAANFQNGPAACTVAVTTQNPPKAPNTGIAALAANPAIALGAASLGAFALVLLGRRLSYGRAANSVKK